MIVTIYPLQVETFNVGTQEDFLGDTVGNIEYLHGLSPVDPKEPNCCYFTISIEHKYVRPKENRVVFLAKTTQTFKLDVEIEKPSVGILYSIVEQASQGYSQYYSQNTINTPIQQRDVPPVRRELFNDDLEKVIKKWESNKGSLLS